ncbi:MAG: flavin-dependent oxidoreductase, partial [Rhodospirillaceae bacterium]|nr:flavin-dependent oxidoreductase [Rhodospirillaceae bacterium]
AETDEEAKELYAEHVNYFFNRCLHVYPGYADAPGYRTIKTIKKGALSQYTRSSLASLGKLTWEELVADGHIIAGSPETVVEKMKELITGLKVGNIFCLLHIGNMTNEKTRLSSRLFAEEVMPKLQNMWPEWEDDERFWIHPLEDRLEPTVPVATMGAAE